MLRGSRFSREGGDLKTPFLAGKERELLESKKWPACFSQHVDITKIQIDAFKPWITRRVTQLMGVEDEIVVDYCISQLKFFGETDAKANTENAGDGGIGLNEKPYLDPKKLQINLTGFMAKNAKIFVKELWDLLIDAQQNEYGIPQEFIDEKKLEIEHIANAAKEAEDNIKQMSSDPASYRDSSTVREVKDEVNLNRGDERSEGETRESIARSRDARRAGRSRSRGSSLPWYKTKKYNRRRSRDRYDDSRREDRSRRYRHYRRRDSSSSPSASRSISPKYASNSRRDRSSLSDSPGRHHYGDRRCRDSTSSEDDRSPRHYDRSRRQSSHSIEKRQRLSRSVSSYSSYEEGRRSRGGRRYSNESRDRNRRHTRRCSRSSTSNTSYESRSSSSRSYGRRDDRRPRSTSSRSSS